MKSNSEIIVNFGANFLNRMMNKMKWFVCLWFLTSVVFRVSAQEVWTLEECIRYAYDNNISLKLQQLQVSKDENDLLQSKLGLLPSVTAGSSFESGKGKVLDMNTFTIVSGQTVQNLSGNVSGSLTLFQGFQQKNMIGRNLYSLMASIQDLEKAKNDLSLNIALYYLQIIHAQEQLAVAENQLALTLLQVDNKATLVNAGKLAEGDLFEIQSQAAREELQIVTARNSLDMYRLNLMQLLDLETRTNFQIAVPDFSDIVISDLLTSVDDLFATAETILPEVKAAEYNLKYSEKQLSYSKGARSPTLTLRGGYYTRYSSMAKWFDPDLGEQVFYPLWDQLRDGVNQSVSVNLSIPIFNKWQVQTGVKNAKISLQNYQYQLQLTKNTLYKEIQQAYADAAAALKKYLAATKAVAYMEETFRYTEQRYKVGLMNFVDYSTTKTQLTSAQSDLLQYKFEYIFKTKVLDFYNGRPITL